MQILSRAANRDQSMADAARTAEHPSRSVAEHTDDQPSSTWTTQLQPCCYCGLPVVGATATKTNGTGPIYCCFGCRVADSVAGGEVAGSEERRGMTRLGVAVFFSMNVMVFTMALWAWDVYPMADSHIAESFRELLRYGCLLFAAPVFVLLGIPLAESGWISLRQRTMNTDLLLFVGVTASFAYSTLSLWLNEPHVYFEVGCMILLAVTLGRWLEATSKQRASRSLRSLERLLPAQTRRIESTGDATVSLEAVHQGDLLRIAAGERIPVDGVVTQRDAFVDEHVITGEAAPLRIADGQPVVGGTLNLHREMVMRVTATAANGTIQRLVDAVTRAALATNIYQRAADRLSAILVPTVALLSVTTFATHRRLDSDHDALLAALSVLLIACPCALAIATPLALWAALTVAARNRVVFRNGDALCRLAKIQAVCFDKTGTLTQGSMSVSQRLYQEPTEATRADALARRLASGSCHPLSKTLGQCLSANLDANHEVSVDNVAEQVGRGVTAYDPTDHSLIILGSLNFVRSRGLQVPSELARSVAESAEAVTPICLGWRGVVRAVYLLQEQIRPEARRTIELLNQWGIRTEILSGDQHLRVEAVARKLATQFTAECLPETKAARVDTLRREAGPVGMVGDGVNDAPALAHADVGIALDGGTDVSRDAADICLLGNTLDRLPWAIQLARETHQTITRNLFWAIIYNVAGVSFAMTGQLTPIVAAFAMLGSSLFVIANTLRLSARHSPCDVLPTQASSLAPILS